MVSTRCSVLEAKQEITRLLAIGWKYIEQPSLSANITVFEIGSELFRLLIAPVTSVYASMTRGFVILGDRTFYATFDSGVCFYHGIDSSNVLDLVEVASVTNCEEGEWHMLSGPKGSFASISITQTSANVIKGQLQRHGS